MKEIVYIQAGSLANFTGTHFWNTQESYFTYDEGDDPVVFHDRSFREGLNDKVEISLTKFFIRRTRMPAAYSTDITSRESLPIVPDSCSLTENIAQFGALPDDLYGKGDASNSAQWGNRVVEYRQERIPKSAYQAQLDSEEIEDTADKSESGDGLTTPDLSDIRYWSDYSRVYFHPRSIQRLRDPADWESVDGDWSTSRETFLQYEHGRDLMETDLRFFVEDCDSLQGIQLMNDCAAFGGFTDAFLVAFRDEYPKLLSLSFPMLSNASNTLVSADDKLETMKVINDALCLRSLKNLSTLNVPIQNPSTWQTNEWLNDIDLDVRSPFHTSALLSAHIESVTLPLRLKESIYDVSAISAFLNPSGMTRFAHLGGVYPIQTTIDWSMQLERQLYDFSRLGQNNHALRTSDFARLHISRGLSSSDIPKYDKLFSRRIPAPFSIHAPPYPTPTSFPRFFKPQLSTTTLTEEPDAEAAHRLLSSLTTTSATSELFAFYARVAQKCVDHHAEVVTRMGLEFDELKELKDELWALCDAYAGEDGKKHIVEVELGEDEE